MEDVVHAVRALAADEARDAAERHADDREWLAQQFEALTVE